MSLKSSILLEEQKARQQLEEIIKKCPTCKSEEDYNLIVKAYEIALEAHRGVRRKSGELYIMHPLAVAQISVEDIGLGPTGICAALLHDVVEDTNYTIDDVKAIFGDRVALIVNGLTKLEGTIDQTALAQVENFRKLLVTMVEDMRVILIKLADRLHNMRTLDSMAEDKKLKIASETLFIYAPIAYRLGFYSIKSELEDLSLKYEHPAIYNEISSKLKDYQSRNEYLITKFALPVIDRLSKEGYEFDIKGRPKSIFSIWTKMQKKQVPFEEIFDLLALRIVFKPKEGISEKTQCWNIYSLITDIYKPKPDRLRDWVSVPRANGYEALHATFMSSEGKWIETQIRSKRMDEIAEKGFAAHWKYKGQDDSGTFFDSWLTVIRDMLEYSGPDSQEFLDSFKMNLNNPEIMIFTPKGDLKIMPKGATMLDFAFEIHTRIGYKCIGAKVNYKLVPMNQELKSGDQVEILTSEKQTPKYEWLNYVTTAKAKTRIKEAFKKDRKIIIQDGEAMLQEALSQKKLTINAKIIKKLLSYFNLSNKDDLYYKIGSKVIRLDNLQEILSDKTLKKWVRYWRLSLGNRGEKGNKAPAGGSIKNNPKSMVVSDDMERENYTIATCCSPIPGDDVMGYHDDKGKITLHSRKCPAAIRLMSSQGNRIVSASWESQKILSFLAVITISGVDQIGIVSKISKVISDDQNVNMRSIHFDSHDGIFEGTIYLYIHDTEALNKIISNITKIKGVHNVTRQERITQA